jgi:hypothetical protein
VTNQYGRRDVETLKGGQFMEIVKELLNGLNTGASPIAEIKIKALERFDTS